MPKFAVITSFLGRTKDRFHEYNEARTLEEKFALLKTIEGASGVEIVYPYEVADAATTRALAAKHGIGFAAINANVKAEPEFRNGGLTSPDKAVRQKAVRIVKEAKDFAEAVGADKVTCCPLGDGYEFAFQFDYASAWKRLAETFGEAAAYKPNIPLFIEFKPGRDPRHLFRLQRRAYAAADPRHRGEELGVTLDFGHVLFSGTNPAEELVILAESGQPYYIHINDNDGKWDWDYFCGTKHLLEYAEFLWYLRRYGYRDYLTSDTSPTRWDIRGTFEANNRITTKLWNLLDRMDAEGLGNMIGSGDYLATWKFLEERLFGLR